MPQNKPEQKNKEKALFLTIWSFIVIAISIWIFWPVAPPRAIPTPDIELAKNITPIFSSAFLTPTESGEYQVTLHLLPDYIVELGKEERELEIGVRFLGDSSVIDESKVYTRLKSDEPINRINIPNPKRYHPKRVLLYLAH